MVDGILSWIVPFYSSLKTVWLLWMLTNSRTASAAVFLRTVYPVMSRNEDTIEGVLYWGHGVLLFLWGLLVWMVRRVVPEPASRRARSAVAAVHRFIAWVHSFVARTPAPKSAPASTPLVPGYMPKSASKSAATEGDRSVQEQRNSPRGVLSADMHAPRSEAPKRATRSFQSSETRRKLAELLDTDVSIDTPTHMTRRAARLAQAASPPSPTASSVSARKHSRDESTSGNAKRTRHNVNVQSRIPRTSAPKPKPSSSPQSIPSKRQAAGSEPEAKRPVRTRVSSAQAGARPASAKPAHTGASRPSLRESSTRPATRSSRRPAAAQRTK